MNTITQWVTAADLMQRDIVAISPNDTLRDALALMTDNHVTGLPDPRTQAALAHYEIFDGTTSDGGASWGWSPITYDSSVDNLRPIAPRGSKRRTVLLWMRGQYDSYTNYNASLVGLINE